MPSLLLEGCLVHVQTVFIWPFLSSPAQLKGLGTRLGHYNLCVITSEFTVIETPLMNCLTAIVGQAPSAAINYTLNFWCKTTSTEVQNHSFTHRVPYTLQKKTC